MICSLLQGLLGRYLAKPSCTLFTFCAGLHSRDIIFPHFSRAVSALGYNIPIYSDSKFSWHFKKSGLPVLQDKQQDRQHESRVWNLRSSNSKKRPELNSNNQVVRQGCSLADHILSCQPLGELMLKTQKIICCKYVTRPFIVKWFVQTAHNVLIICMSFFVFYHWAKDLNLVTKIHRGRLDLKW